MGINGGKVSYVPRKKILANMGYYPVRRGSDIAKNAEGRFKFVSKKGTIVGRESGGKVSHPKNNKHNNPFAISAPPFGFK